MLQVLPLREEVAELRADVAEEPSEAQPREELGLGHPYVRVCRNQDLLGLTDVRPPLQEGRGKARRDVGREGRGGPSRGIGWGVRAGGS